ncbi:hypothetical protein A45J_1849 [hot springs metagenome]|uniref:Uncharacterized protein n=1 Tax=hot springs metagenome TaxID=433727 RepID=A0A5J4L5H2_9ZZZZ
MWDIKFVKTDADAVEWYQFHLNHVGYKGLCVMKAGLMQRYFI